MSYKDNLNKQSAHAKEAKSIIREVEELINCGDFEKARNLTILNVPVFGGIFKSLKMTELINVDKDNIFEAKECIDKIDKLLDNKIKKIGKKSLSKSLPSESDLTIFTKSLGVSIDSFMSHVLIESYQTFASKPFYDKELMMNGGVPLVFNKNLKTIRLVNFFRAVKYASVNVNSLLVGKEDFRSSLDMGKILRQIDENGINEDIVYFRDINDKCGRIFCVDYKKGIVFTPTKLTRADVSYKEVFARLDYKYITKINILKLAYREILEDMLIDEVDEKLVKKRNLDIKMRMIL